MDTTISKMGMFSKSFWAMKQDLAHGHGIGFSIFGGNGFAKGDKQAVLDFNTALKNGVKPAKAWATTMANASINAQNMTRSTLRAKGNLVELANGMNTFSLKAKFAEIRLQAFNIALNVGIMLAVTKAIELFATALDNLVVTIDEIKDRIEENKTAITEYTSKIEELTEKLNDLNNASVGYFSEGKRKEIELEKQYIESQIELYNQLTEAKEKAVSDDYIRVTMGTNKEIAIKKLWSELKSGDMSGLQDTGKELLNGFNLIDYLGLINGSSAYKLLNQVDDGNSFAEADKLIDKYKELNEEYINLQKQSAKYGGNEILTEKTDETASEMLQTSADIAVAIEQIAEARDFLKDSKNSEEYADEIAKMDEAIKKYQEVLNGNFHASKYSGFDELQRDLLGLRDVILVVVGEIEDFPGTKVITGAFNGLISLVDKLKTYSFKELLTLGGEELTKELNKIKDAFKNLNVLDTLKDKLKDMIPKEAIELWNDLEKAIDLVQERFEELFTFIGSTKVGSAIIQSFETISEAIQEMFDPIENFVSNYGNILGGKFAKMKKAWDDAHAVDYIDTDRLVQQFGKKNIDTLSQEDLTIAYQIENVGDMTFEDLKNKIEEIKNGSDIVVPEDNTLSLDNAKLKVLGDSEKGVIGLREELELLQEVLADTGNISQETYEKLLSCSKDYVTSIRTENGRITVNTNKLKQVAKQRGIDTKATIKQTLAIKKQEWLQWKNKIENYNGTLLDSIETKYDDINALQAEITQYELLVNSLDNATSAFERFKAAQETDDKDMYTTTQDAFNVLKEYSNDSSSENYGQYNRDEFQEAAMLLMDTDTYKKALNAKDLVEYQKVVKGFVKSISPLFDENNAKSASKLFDEVDKILASGDIPVADKDWANRLGISKEAFNALKQLANLYDYNNKEVFESFPLDKLDDYQEKVSNVAAEYEALNAIEDKTSNEYLKQEQAYKQAKEKRDTFIEETTTDMSNAFTNYQKSGGMDGRTFTDYVKDQFDFEDTDITGSIFTLIDKADELKKRMDGLTPEEQKQYAIYDQFQGIVDILDALGYKYIEAADNIEKFNEVQNKQKSDETFKKNMESFEDLKKQEEMFKRTMANSEFGSEMYTGAQNDLAQVQSQLEELRGSLQLKLELDISDVNTKIGEVEKAKQKFQQENSGLQDTIYYRGRTAGYDAELEQLNSQKDTLEKKLKLVVEGDEEAKAAIDDLNSSEMPDKILSIFAKDNATSVIDEVNSKKILDKTFKINAKVNVPDLILGQFGAEGDVSTGVHQLNGTARFSHGHAYADGNIGTDKSLKNVMVGEIAPEMVIDPHSGEYTIYHNPTMLDKLPKDAIVFNGKQTEEILKNGMTTSFGKAYANGNVEGKAFGNGTGTKVNIPNFNDVKDNNNAIKDAKKNAEKEKEEEKELTEEFFDWIERRVQKLQRYFDRWVKNAETALTSGFITKYYNKARKNLNKQLDVQSKAYSRYLEEANKSGLSDDYKKKVRDGLIDIETITDDTLKEQISKYQESYDKAVNSLTAFEEAAEKRFNIPLDKATKKVELFSKSIELLDKKLDNAIGSKDKNKLIDKQTKEEKKTLNAYKTAVKNSETNLKNQSKKMKSKDVLNSSDVSSKEKKKIKNAVKNGKEIDLSFFKEGSKAYKQAVKYNEALKANKQAQYDLNVATEEYNAWLVEAAKMKFDNIADEYEYAIKQIENNFTDIDNKIAEIEAIGKRVDKSLYESQKKLNDQELAKYKAELVALEESKKGIKQGTDEWYEALDAIQEVENSISKCTQEAAKLNKSIRELHFSMLDDMFEGIDRITKEQGFLQGLFAHEKLTDDDTGDLTEAGIAKLGSLTAQYYANEEKKELATSELNRLKSLLAKGDATGVYGDADTPYNSRDELMDDIDKYYDAVQDYTSKLYDSATEIYDLMEQKYQAELEYIKKLIDDQKEALQSQKDLHDYQNTINEKVNSIDTLQKQISAYSGDTSQEGMAKLQKLQKELNDTTKDLKETEYDRYISDQQDMLDKFATEYEEAITNQLEDFKTIVSEGIATANDDMSTVKNYLGNIASEAGYTEQTQGLFDSVSGSINANINDAITDIIDTIQDSASDGDDDDSGSNSGSSNSSNANSSNSNSNNTNNNSNKVDLNAGTPDVIKEADEEYAKARAAQLKQEWANKKKKVEAIFGDSKLYKKGDKNKTYKTEINKYLMKNNGKVLTTAGLKELREALMVKKNSELLNAMKELKEKNGNANIKHVGGFKTGGIAKLIKSRGEDGLMLARNGEGFVSPEHVPAIQELLDTVPLMNNMFKPLVEAPKIPNLTPVNNAANNILQIDTLTLPNVTNWDEFRDKMYKDMQSNKKFEGMVQDMSINQVSGGGRLSKYNRRF